MKDFAGVFVMRALVIDGFGETGRDIDFQIGVGPRLIATVIDKCGVECDLASFRIKVAPGAEA